MSNTIALKTIVIREITRFTRIWQQTLLPPAITMSLYFVIFGKLIGPRIGEMEGFTYIQFIVPGLIMMSVITNAYNNVVSSFYSLRFQKSVEEIVISPTSNTVILLGFVAGGVARGLCVAVVVTIVSLFFTHLHIHHLLIMITTITLSAILFSLAGFTNSIYARSFDDISIVPIFILTPLTYLGGVFYSVSLLPDFWRTLSLGNPILYMVNAFRYGLLGVSDIPISFAFFIILSFIVVLFWINLRLLNKGVGIRT